MQTSDSESAGSGACGNDDSVSVERVRFDDNVSFIEATSSPVSAGSSRSRGNDKTFDTHSDMKQSADKTGARSMLFHSGPSTSNGDKQLPKLRKSCPYSEVDLSGIEISVDGKPLDVIIEPICVSSDSVNTTPDVSVPVEVDSFNPGTLEVSSL